MHCLAIVQPLPGIGDVVVHASHIRAIALHYHAERTVLFAKQSSLAAQYAHLFGINEIHDLPESSRNLRPDLNHTTRKDTKKNIYHKMKFIMALTNLLKQHAIDQIIILHPSLKFAIAAKLAGIPRCFGYGHPLQTYWLSQSFSLPRTATKQLYHTKKCDLFLKHMGICQQPLLPQMTPPKIKQQNEQIPQPCIALGIGASGIDKQWGSQHFTILCHWIIHHSNHHIVLCGGPDEQYIVDHIMLHIDHSHHKRILHTCHHKILTAIKYMAQAYCYVGNDTGFLHIAVALNKPSIGLFGSPFQAVLGYSPLITACTPDLNDTQRNSIPGHKHILHITPPAVIDKLQPMLKQADSTLIQPPQYQHLDADHVR